MSVDVHRIVRVFLIFRVNFFIIGILVVCQDVNVRPVHPSL
jgi:hypothetical protein